MILNYISKWLIFLSDDCIAVKFEESSDDDDDEEDSSEEESLARDTSTWPRQMKAQYVKEPQLSLQKLLAGKVNLSSSKDVDIPDWTPNQELRAHQSGVNSLHVKSLQGVNNLEKND